MARLAALLAVVLVAGVAPNPSPMPSPSQAPPHRCVLSSHRGEYAENCAYKNVGIHIQAVIPNRAFGKGRVPKDIAVLSNGTVLVQTDGDALYRIVNGRVGMLWGPNARCGTSAHFQFSFAQPFDDELLLNISAERLVDDELVFGPYSGGTIAVRADGSLAFRLPASSSSIDSVEQDAEGTLWLLYGNMPNQEVRAFSPRARTSVLLQPPLAVYKMFRSNGHVYVTNFQGLFELDARPTVTARFVHGPIQGRPIQVVGRDGSFWASTSTDVIHVHPNGAIRVMQLIAPPMSLQMLHPQPDIDLTMAPDGSVWASWDKRVRIDDDDRIEVLTVPGDQLRAGVKLGRDSSLWVLASDPRDGQPLGIVNFVPARPGLSANPWPFKTTGSPPSPTAFEPCPFPTTPPMPTPPSPPPHGALNFLYTGNLDGRGVRGFWIGHNKKLTPVRGSPFAAGNDQVSLAIDPTGRYLYAGTWYDGIFAYSLDAQTGTLRAVPGSPFQTGTGPTFIAISADGYAYAVNINAKNVTGYAIDAATGALRPLSWSPFAMARRPERIALNRKRGLAYVVTDASVETFALAGGTFRSVAAPLGRFGSFVRGLLIDREANWFYMSHEGGGITVNAIDPQTGVLRVPPAGQIAAGNESGDMVTDPRGRFLYVADIAQRATILGYRINARTGLLTPLPTSPFKGAGADAMTITPDGKYLYVTNFNSKQISGFAIDSQTGALWPLAGSPFTAGDGLTAIVSCRRSRSVCKAQP